jgi:small subunit ribosomal protein SAe
MKPYVWKRNKDGIHIIHLGKTWEKLMLAARIIAGIQNPEEVLVAAVREYAQRPILKFAQYTGAKAMASKWTPGTLTNQITKKFLEPRLLIVSDPRVDMRAVKEACYMNIPCIAFCDTDSPIENVDLVIPCNTKAKESIALLYWILAREVLYLRGTIKRTAKWEVVMDLFVHKTIEELEKQQKEKEEKEAKEEEKKEESEKDEGEHEAEHGEAKQETAQAWDNAAEEEH